MFFSKKEHVDIYINMLVFEIPGIPVPQKQTKFIRSTGIAYNPSKKDTEALQAKIRPSAPKEPLTCAIEMHLYFGLPIPKSTSQRLRFQMLKNLILPKKKPDFDNLAYLVTNALKKIVYEDDSQVTDCVIKKRYDENPKTIIKIIPLNMMGTPIDDQLCA